MTHVPRNKKQRRRERREAQRHNMTLLEWRAYLEAKAGWDKNSYRRKKRADADAQ